MLPGPSPAVSAEPPLASVACSPLLPVSRTWLPCSAPDLAEFSCPVTRFLLQASHQPSASLSPEGAIFLEFFFSFFIIIWCGPHQFSVARWPELLLGPSPPPLQVVFLPFLATSRSDLTVSHQSLFSEWMRARKGGQSAFNTCHSLVTRVSVLLLFGLTP